MGGFSAREAALAGVWFTKKNPQAILAWAAIYFGYQIALATLTLAIGLRTPAAGVHATGALVLKGIEAFVLGLSGLPVSAVLWTAAFRAFLRPRESAFFHMRLGTDEVRMGGLLVLTVLLAILAGPFLILITLLGHGLVAAVLPSALVILTPIICTRFILSPALTLDQGRIRVFESWRLTRGHFLVLAGLLLAAMALSVVLSRAPALVLLALTNPHELAMQPMEALRAVRPSPRTVEDVLAPQALLWRVYLSGVAAIKLVIWAGISATAYAGLRQTSEIIDNAA